MSPYDQNALISESSSTAVAAPNLLSRLPSLWSRILFPGKSATDTGTSWRSILILLVLPGALLYPCLSFHLFEPDEGRYAEIPREMLERGDWVVPYLQGEPYLDKPPLLYWLLMIGYRFLGVQVWAARLVPALAVHGCILATYFLGRRIVGEKAAFVGGLALSLAPGFISMGRLLVLDGPLSLCVTLSLFAAFNAVGGRKLRWGWWLFAALSCGLGVLAKGPVALVLLLPPVWAYRWLNGSSCRIGWQGHGVFAAVLATVVLPWYVAICWKMPNFAGYFLWEHNVVRFLSPFDHQRPIWFYGPILAVGLLPASLLLAPFVRFLLSGQEESVQRRSPELGFMLLAGGWCVLFFTLSGCKLPTYILPSFPPLALALGVFVTGSHWQKSRLVHVGVLVGIVLLGVTNYVAMPWYARFHSPLCRPEMVERYCEDPSIPVVCYPRSCDSVSFHLRRDNLQSYRSKQTPALIRTMLDRPRTVILFTHRHSLEGLRQVLPPQLRLTNETPLSGSWRNADKPEMCFMAIVERR